MSTTNYTMLHVRSMRSAGKVKRGFPFERERESVGIVLREREIETHSRGTRRCSTNGYWKPTIIDSASCN